jgi:hypothetical protein
VKNIGTVDWKSIPTLIIFHINQSKAPQSTLGRVSDSARIFNSEIFFIPIKLSFESVRIQNTLAASPPFLINQMNIFY